MSECEKGCVPGFAPNRGCPVHLGPITRPPLGARPAFLDAALPTDSEERKNLPLVSGALDYFPAAWAEIARLSKYGNDKHNPGEELHHARGKSRDHADCIVRHLVERGTMDPSGFSHTVMVAWRALALLQEELEAAGAPLARGARLPEITDEDRAETAFPRQGHEFDGN